MIRSKAKIIKALIIAGSLLTATHLNAANVTVVISGLGGSDDFTEKFDDYATKIADSAKQIALKETDVMLLRGSAAKKEIITALFDALATRNDINQFSAYFIGHGSFDGRLYKFNIPGPDINAIELADLLNKIKARQQLVVAATSSSGALLEVLDTGNQTVGQRVVITATKNGREKTAVMFPEYMVEGITTPVADTDKNESITAQEMFDYANRAVEGFFETEKLLAPEHARLQGENAQAFEVARYGNLLAAQDNVPEDLLANRETLANQINILRSRKEDLDEDEYFDTLQGLMLKLSEVQNQIDTASGQPGN